MQKISLKRTWLLGTLAIIIKQIVFFNVLTLFVFSAPTKRRSITMIILSLITYFLSFSPYISSSNQIVNNVLGHTGDIGSFGIARELPTIFTIPIFLIVMSLLPYLSKYRFNFSITEGLLISSLAFVVLTPGFYPHYLVMPILAGTLIPSIWYYIFTFISLDVILRYLFGQGMPLNVGALTWLFSTLFLSKFFLTVKNPS
jgi:hypothetical protein